MIKTIIVTAVVAFAALTAAGSASATPSICSSKPDDLVQMVLELNDQSMDMEKAAKKVVNQIAQQCPNAYQIAEDFQNQYGG